MTWMLSRHQVKEECRIRTFICQSSHHGHCVAILAQALASKRTSQHIPDLHGSGAGHSDRFQLHSIMALSDYLAGSQPTLQARSSIPGMQWERMIETYSQLQVKVESQQVQGSLELIQKLLEDVVGLQGMSVNAFSQQQSFSSSALDGIKEAIQQKHSITQKTLSDNKAIQSLPVFKDSKLEFKGWVDKLVNIISVVYRDSRSFLSMLTKALDKDRRHSQGVKSKS